jgi:hypothetical protein
MTMGSQKSHVIHKGLWNPTVIFIGMLVNMRVSEGDIQHHIVDI